MNKVILTGRITKDPELRYTQSGMATLAFTVAVDRQVRATDGTRQADFINCVAWGQQADFMSRYVHKGNMLAVAGRIQTRNYQGQDGQTRYVTEVVVESVENMTPRDPNMAPQRVHSSSHNRISIRAITTQAMVKSHSSQHKINHHMRKLQTALG